VVAAWGRLESNAAFKDELACGTNQKFPIEIALDGACNAAGFNEEGK
jgi:hypothetical protein